MDEYKTLLDEVFSPAAVGHGTEIRKPVNIKLRLRNGITLKDLGLTKNQAKVLTAILLTLEVKGFTIPSVHAVPTVMFSSPDLTETQLKLFTYIGTSVTYKMLHEQKSLICSCSEIFLDILTNCQQFLICGKPATEFAAFSQMGMDFLLNENTYLKLFETLGIVNDLDKIEIPNIVASMLVAASALENTNQARRELTEKLAELSARSEDLAWNEEAALTIESVRQNCEKFIHGIEKQNLQGSSLKQAAKPITKAGTRSNHSLKPKSSNINAKNQKTLPSSVKKMPNKKADLSNIPKGSYRAPASINSSSSGKGNNNNKSTYSTPIRFRVPKQAPPGCPTSPSMGITTISNSKNKKTKNKKSWWSLKRDKPILPDNFPFWTWGGHSTMMLTVFEAYQLIWIYAFIEVSVKSYKYNNSIRIEKLQLIKGFPTRCLKKLEQNEIAWLIIGSWILGTILILTELANINSLAIRSSEQQYFEMEQLRANIPSHERIVPSIDLEPNFAVVDSNQQSSKSDQLQEKQHKITSSAESDSLNSSNSKIKRKFKFKIRRKRKTSYFKNRSSSSIKVNQRKKFIPLEERTKTIRDLNSDENQNKSGNEEFKSIFDGYTTRVITHADGTKSIMHSDYSKK